MGTTAELKCLLELPDKQQQQRMERNLRRLAWQLAYVGIPVNSATSRLWQPYGSGPNTAHIVWSIPFKAGGIIGGAYGSLSYASAISFPSATIMDGKVFVNIPNENEFECIDLTTGQVLYTATGQITCGLHLPGNPYAQSHSCHARSNDSSSPYSYGNSPTSYLFAGGSSHLDPWHYMELL